MRIAVISNYKLGSEAGVANVSENLSRHLSKKNKVLYVCLGDKYEYSKKNNLSILKLPSSPIRQGFIPRLTPKAIDKFKSDLKSFNPDVIHAQNIVFASVVALTWAVAEGIPFVVTFHSLPSEGIVWFYPQFKKDKLISAIDFRITAGYVKRFLENTDLSICLNYAVEKSVKKIFKKAKTKILNNPLYLESFYNLKINTPEKDINFVYLGSYMSKKNQEFLIKVFSYLPQNYKLELYGNIESGKDYVKKLKKEVAANNLKNVKIGSFLNRKRVLKTLEKSHYFVSASLKEVQSLVIVEALASGIPVIALKNETTQELIDSKNGLLLPQKTSPKIFAKKLKEYVSKKDQGYLYIANYCRLSVSHFDINKVNSSLEEIYRELKNKKDKDKLKKKKTPLLLEELIPEKYWKLFNEKIMRKLNDRKPRALKFLLSITIIFSILASGVLFIFKLPKKLRRSK